MTEKIQSKINFDSEYMITRLKAEFNIEFGDKQKEQFLSFALFDVINIILEQTNLKVLNNDVESLIISMTKDYFVLQGYDKNTNEENKSSAKDKIGDVKAITRGDTKTEFYEGVFEINGIKYSVDSFDASKDILITKYQDRLNKFRVLGW